MLDPREVGWAMHGDWQVHFLGWQFFRHEPWQWPPGAIRKLHGTNRHLAGLYRFHSARRVRAEADRSVGCPNRCSISASGSCLFALQGFFGALRHVHVDATAGVAGRSARCCSFSVPGAFARIAHPALCAHWLIVVGALAQLAAEPSLTRDAAASRRDRVGQCARASVLAVMVLALLVALAGQRVLVRARSSAGAVRSGHSRSRAMLATGWWASGLFVFAGRHDRSQSAGLCTR